MIAIAGCFCFPWINDCFGFYGLMVEMLGVKAITVRCGEDKVEFFSGDVGR